MVVLKERCPNCGGTIFISDPSGAGECDSCGSVFSLSDLQKIKETIAFNQARIRENDYGAEGSERCEAALDTSDTEEMPFEELCLKTEMALEAEQWRVAKNFVEEIVRRNPKFAKAYLYRIMIERKVFKKEELAKQEKPFDDSDHYRLLMRFADVYLKSEMEQYNETIKRNAQERALEKRYQSLCSKLQNASKDWHYQDLANGFKSLGAYKNSARLSEECLAKFKIAHEQARKKAAIRSVIIIAGVVLAIIMLAFAIAGVVAAVQAPYRAELFTAEVTDKVNVDYDDDTVSCSFEFNVRNESRRNVRYLEAAITISDKEGNLLASGNTWYRGTIASEQTKYFDITLDFDRDTKGVYIWNSDFSDLVVTYQITKIEFDNGRVKEYTNNKH